MPTGGLRRTVSKTLSGLLSAAGALVSTFIPGSGGAAAHAARLTLVDAPAATCSLTDSSVCELTLADTSVAA
jgi:hypothetical protein